MVTPCNDEQRGQAARQAHNRTRCGLTRLVNVIEGANACRHGTFQGLMSGQQRNLGLKVGEQAYCAAILVPDLIWKTSP